MATIYRKPGSTFYWMRFQHKKKRYQESTGIRFGHDENTDAKRKMKARTVMQKRVAQVRGAGGYLDLFERLMAEVKKLPEKNRDRVRRDLALQLTSATDSRLAITDAWAAWEASPDRGNAGISTVKGYAGIWAMFTVWLAEKHKKVQYVHDITDAVAKEYRTELWGKGLSVRTYKKHLTFLRGMLAEIGPGAGLPENPWPKPPDKKAMPLETQSKRMFTAEELAEVCRKADGTLRCWIAMGLYTGLGLGDVVTLKWSEIDFRKKRIVRVPRKTRRKGEAVTLPLHPVLEAMLHELKRTRDKGSEYVFPEDAETYETNPPLISNRIQAHFVDCGIETTEKPAADGHGPRRKRAIVRVGFHSLRHSFVSLCAANNVPQVAVMELVGHNSTAVNDIYQHANDELKEKAIAGLPEYKFPGDK